MTSNWMIYGANGFSAQLAVEKAVTQGRRPILAGRNAAAIEPLAQAYGLESRILYRFTSKEILPAGGQGAVGVECRFADKKTLAFLQCLHDSETAYQVIAERSLNKALNGGCQAPIASFAEFNSATGELYLRGMVGDVEGIRILLAEGQTTREDAEDLGRSVAKKLLDLGAQKLLDQVNSKNKASS